MSRVSYTRLELKDGAGAAAEAQFRTFLKFQSGTFKSVPFESEEKILNQAAKCHPAKLNTLMNYYRYSFNEMVNLGSAELMDCLFKTDFLVGYEDINGLAVKLAIDVTTTHKTFNSKKKQMLSLRNSLKELGVNRTLIVSWNRKDLQDLTRAESYSIAGAILDLLDSNSYFCNTIVLNKDVL